jgi:hypothetical protein
MNRNVLFTTSLALLLSAVFAFAPAAHAQIGIAAGFNYNQLDDIRTENVNADFENAAGYHIGVFYDLGLGTFALRPGIFYRQLGTYEFGELPDLEEGESFNLNAVEVPIDVRLRLLPRAPVKPYLLAGPVITFPQSDEFDSTKNINLNADIGAGVEIVLPGVGFTLMPELRYGIATSSLIEDEFEVRGVDVQPQDDPRLNSISLRLNVRF